MSRITVIYVSYNSGEEILASVRSLRENGCRHELKIIVVDNASPDGSAEMLVGDPEIQVIANEVNLGYGRAVNLGIEAADGDYYLILNPDVTVNAGSIDRLVAFMETHPDAGIAGAKLLNEDGSLQHSCRSFYTFWTILLRRTPLGKLLPRSNALSHHLMLDYDHAEDRRVDWVLGACMLVRPQAVADVGGMDRRFFLYFEDVDWCYRMGKRGWHVWYVADAVMNHLHKRASARRNPFSRSLLIHVTSFIHYTEKWNPVSYLLKRYRDPIKGLGLLLLDFTAINLAVKAATWLRTIGLAGAFEHTYYVPEAYQRFLLFYNVIILGTFFIIGLYRTNRRVSVSEELLALIRAALLAGVTLMSATYLTHERVVSRVVILLSVTLMIFFTLFLRTCLRRLHRAFLRYNFDLRRVLIVGSPEEAHELGGLILKHPELGLDLVGRVSASDIDGQGALGRLAELETISVDERVQEIIFAPSLSALTAVASTLLWCKRRSIDLRVLSEMAGVMSRGAAVEDFLGRPAIAYRMEGLYPLQHFLKRAFDIVWSLPLCLISLVPGLLVRSTLRGRGVRVPMQVPVLGRGGNVVQLPLVMNDRNRILSDLCNPWLYLAVLTGHLSLVGPAPRLRPDMRDMDMEDILAMRPGLTGYWRREGEGKEAGGMDLLYLRNWSLGLDAQIWLATLGAQMRGRYPTFLIESLDLNQPVEKGEE
ncbi:MAG: glycosyltransferase [bacterium]|nr:glycosyltransferase [bacterium]